MNASNQAIGLRYLNAITRKALEALADSELIIEKVGEGVGIETKKLPINNLIEYSFFPNDLFEFSYVRKDDSPRKVIQSHRHPHFPEAIRYYLSPSTNLTERGDIEVVTFYPRKYEEYEKSRIKPAPGPRFFDLLQADNFLQCYLDLLKQRRT